MEFKNSKGKALTGRDLNRMKVRVRDNFTCKDCGIQRTQEEVINHNKKLKGLKGKIKLFDIHHEDGLCGKKSKGYDKPSDFNKLVTLCHFCHYNRPEHRHLSSKPLTRKDREKIISLYEAGHKYQFIADVFSVGYLRIYAIVNQKTNYVDNHLL